MAGNKKTIKQLNLLYTIIMEFLKNCNIKLILFYGSLLGYHRDNSFIDMDDDIDIIVSDDDYKILLEYVKNNNVAVNNIKIGINKQNLIQLFYNDIGPFDIYRYEDYNNDILIRWDGNLLYEKKLIYPLKQVKFNNYDIYIPNSPDEILLKTYGKNWITPQTKNIDYKWDNINTVRKL
jgi:phosphorylcholine metabolism protein LicD